MMIYFTLFFMLLMLGELVCLFLLEIEGVSYRIMLFFANVIIRIMT